MGRDFIMHHGVPRQQWHHRRWQNPDGSYTDAGFIHYYGHPRIRNTKATRDENGKMSKDEYEKKRIDLYRSASEAGDRAAKRIVQFIKKDKELGKIYKKLEKTGAFENRRKSTPELERSDEYSETMDAAYEAAYDGLISKEEYYTLQDRSDAFGKSDPQCKQAYADRRAAFDEANRLDAEYKKQNGNVFQKLATQVGENMKKSMEFRKDPENQKKYGQGIIPGLINLYKDSKQKKTDPEIDAGVELLRTTGDYDATLKELKKNDPEAFKEAVNMIANKIENYDQDVLDLTPGASEKLEAFRRSQKEAEVKRQADVSVEDTRDKQNTPLKKGLFESKDKFKQRVENDDRVKRETHNVSEVGINYVKAKNEVKKLEKQLGKAQLNWAKTQPDLQWLIKKYGSGASSLQDVIKKWKQDSDNNGFKGEFTPGQERQAQAIIDRSYSDSKINGIRKRIDKNLDNAMHLGDSVEDKLLTASITLSQGNAYASKEIYSTIRDRLNHVVINEAGGSIWDDFWDNR